VAQGVGRGFHRSIIVAESAAASNGDWVLGLQGLHRSQFDIRPQACYNDYKVRSITNKPMTFVDELCAQLKARGRRITPQRRAIIRVLQEDHSHPTAEQVFTRARRMMPDISRATVYNALHELVEIGMVRELDLGLRERHYDITGGEHAHLICLGCGHIEDVPYNCDTLAIPRERVPGFEVVDCNVVLRGYCPACASQAESQDKASQ
jgi:Fur family ferric uptake transcriptional regulator